MDFKCWFSLHSYSNLMWYENAGTRMGYSLLLIQFEQRGLNYVASIMYYIENDNNEINQILMISGWKKIMEEI